MLMIPNEDETTVHGCHGRGDVVVRMCEVLAIPRSWYMCFSTEEGYFGHALFHIIINRDKVEVPTREKNRRGELVKNYSTRDEKLLNFPAVLR